MQTPYYFTTMNICITGRQMPEWQEMKFVACLGSGWLLWAMEVSPAGGCRVPGPVQRAQWDSVHLQVPPWPVHNFTAHQLTRRSHQSFMFDRCSTSWQSLCLSCSHYLFFCFLLTPLRITALVVHIIWTTKCHETAVEKEDDFKDWYFEERM